MGERVLDRGGSLGEFVEEQDSGPGGGEKVGQGPAGRVAVDGREAAHIDGVAVGRPQVAELERSAGRGLGDNLGFSDARGPPNKGGAAGPDGDVKGIGNL